MTIVLDYSAYPITKSSVQKCTNVRRMDPLIANETAGNSVGHPLHEARPSLAEVLEHPFVTCAEEDDVHEWPPNTPRRVGMVVSDLRLALQICGEGELLTVAPDVFAKTESSSRVVRLPIDVRPSPVLAMRRTTLDTGAPLELLVVAALDELRALAGNSHSVCSNP